MSCLSTGYSVDCSLSCAGGLYRFWVASVAPKPQNPTAQFDCKFKWLNKLKVAPPDPDPLTSPKYLRRNAPQPTRAPMSNA